MPKISASKQLSLSDLIRNPSSIVKDFDEIPDDNDAEYVKEYGIGIDCHSKFIEVCIRYRCGKLIYKAQSTFTTEWGSLVAARDWCLSVLKTKADPVPDLSEPLHYFVESNISCGLSLSGTVIDRTRRMVPRENPTIEIVTYTV